MNDTVKKRLEVKLKMVVKSCMQQFCSDISPNVNESLNKFIDEFCEGQMIQSLFEEFEKKKLGQKVLESLVLGALIGYAEAKHKFEFHWNLEGTDDGWLFD